MGVLWAPQPGPQTYAATCPVDEIFFGGQRGGGKSDCAIGRQVRGAEVYGSHWNGLMVRRKYKDFAEIRRRIDELITIGMPAERIGGENQTNYIKFHDGPHKGAKITLAAIKELKQIDDFLGHQYTEVSIDEAPSFSFISQLIDKVRGCLRSPHGVPCRLFMTGNPGGPGANSIKMLYIKKAPPNTVFKTDFSTAIFIPSSLADNKILCDKDPAYVHRLQSIKDPALRAAWLLGDWDAFIGQAFDFSRDYHVIPYRPIPKGAPLYMTYDFGFGAPFSVGWWWVDAEGRLFRFAEWYGWDGTTPNVGCRWEDSRVGQGIKEREERLGIAGQNIIRLGSHDSWNKKPDYKGGGQGPSTAEIWAQMGIYLIKADPSRHLKIRQFRERLKVQYLNLDAIAVRLGLNAIEDPIQGHVWLDGSGNIVWERKLVEMARMKGMQLPYVTPMLQVYDTCVHFIRTIPELCVDENDVEDIDTDGEDHCLHGDTTVVTDCGDIPIRYLVGTKGKVLTVDGEWTNYHDCRLTRRAVDVVEVEFEDGRSLKCTTDHKFLTSKGIWVEAKDLIDKQCHVMIAQREGRIIPWMSLLSARQYRSSTASDTGYVGIISSEKASAFIGLCGYITMDPFRRLIMSIIKTMSDQITKLKTLRSVQVFGTYLTMLKSPILPNGLNLCAEGLLNGMEATRAVNGTFGTTKIIARKLFLQSSKRHASSVTVSFGERNIPGSVPDIASNGHGNSKTGPLKEIVWYAAHLLRAMADRISEHALRLVGRNIFGVFAKPVSVESAGKADVYCLDVDHASHAFAVCGGVLVHNCYDEATQVCMARPVALKIAAPPKLQADQRIDYVERMVASGADSYEQYAHIEKRREEIVWQRYMEQDFFGDDRPSQRGAYSDIDGR